MNQSTSGTTSPAIPDNLRLRPTLVIGLGGTGHRVVVWIKAMALQSWERERVHRVIRFLVFDTAQESLTVTQGGQPVHLEPGSEFVDIGQTPVAKIKRNLAHQTAIRERLGGVMTHLPPAVLRNGAKQLRPLGLLAFLWRYNEVEERLQDAIWGLANRQRSESREGINVFIINSLVGGTGSSLFLDVAHLVRDLFDHLGTLADFCYITGVGVLPRAFHGIRGPNLVPNAVASLKELNHCMMHGDFTTRYPTGRTLTTTQPPFNIYYLVDGVDERGHTWRGLDEICRLAAEAVFLQMGSQVGRKSENDFDNVDDVLVQQTEEGEGTFCGSFGLASLVFPGPVVARACAARHATQVIEHGLLASPASKLAAYRRPEGTKVAGFVQAAGLDPARLVEQLNCDDQGTPLSVELVVPGWAHRLSPRSAPAELVRYVREYERVRLGTDFKRWLAQNEGRLADAAATILTDRVTRLARQVGLPATEAFLTGLLAWLEEQASRLSTRQVEDEGRLAGLTRSLAHLETVFLQAGEGSFLGRKRRVIRAQGAYFTAAQRLYSLRWRAQVTAGTLAVLNHVSRVARDGLTACRAAMARLGAAHRILREAGSIEHLGGDDGPAPTGITTRSLADEALVTALFERHVPPVADTLAALFSGDASPLDWHDAALETVQAALLDACRPAFEPIAAMSVEEAITLRTDEALRPARSDLHDEASPEGYYRWLMAQATPSWNLDRTRLPDAGAGLQRLEVLGVPDETNSIYRQYARMLVSTGDRSRLTAFVAHIGAAHTAIQGWDGYQAAYDRARSHVPLHVLPQFQTEGEYAHQAFALGSLFEFIQSRGAYFYYVPADPLARPRKLAQGLANALQVFTQQDGLVQETWDRIEQRVSDQGVKAVLKRLTAYYEANDGQAPTDDLVLELKRLVRAYVDQLRQIHQFGPWVQGDEEEEDDAG